MNRLWSITFLLSILTITVLSDFLAPTYPPPKDLVGENSHVATGWKNLTSTIETYLNNQTADLTGLPGLKNLTFSLGMFSIYDAAAAGTLQYHYASAEVANSTTGITKVDGNAIYRVASVTKLFTVFAGMLNLDDPAWDRPITDFVPALAEFARNRPWEDDPVNTIQWDQVTLAALGAQIAGGPRDVAPYDPSDYLYTSTDPVGTYGLPTLNLTDPLAVPPCATSTNGTCTADQYAQGAEARPPVFLPWTSPEYTDFGFMMLGLAIANITNKSIHDVYDESIFHPLNMGSSSSLPPSDNSTFKKYVIPGDISNAAFFTAQAPEITIPSGGIFSTTNDLAKLGTALLNCTLLPPDQTRRWMKPVSHTAQLQYSVGRPWEIYRYIHPTSGIITDIYTKLGDSGAYGGYIILLPDFGAGFSILGASSLAERTTVNTALADLITETMLPALLAQAETEAEGNFAGTYVSDEADLNTTLIISRNQSEGAKPGLVISSFISNGTDVISSTIFGGEQPIRLLPTISDTRTKQAAFRTSPTQIPSGGLFSGALDVAFDWLGADSGTYGGLAVGLFVFDLSENGTAKAVRPAAWRVKLTKES